MESTASRAWYRQAASRFVILWPLKALGTMAGLALFFWGYFAVLRMPLGVPTVMPLTGLDRWVPFAPAAFPIYASLWVYVSLPPALLVNLRQLLLFGAWMAGLCGFCLAIFWVFPTTVPAADIDWSLYPEMAVIKDVDAGGNACPSLHVASAVFAALWLERLCRALAAPWLLRAANLAHCLAILWSTLATRQHVVLDVAAGLLVGAVFAVLGLRQVEGEAGRL